MQQIKAIYKYSQIMFLIIFMASPVSAELKLESVYPAVGILEQALDVNLTGTGFDGDTKIFMLPDIGNQQMVITAADTPGNAYGVTIADGVAYVADGERGLQIIDINPSDRSSVIGWADTPGQAYDVVLSGRTAYVADGTSGLQVIDVSNPSAPRILGAADTPGDARCIAVAGNTACVADGETGLQVIDISNPEDPFIKGSADTQGNAYGIAVSGDIAYIADGTGGLQLVNISNPSAPVTKGSVNTPGTAYAVTIAGNFAYVADGESGLQITDISDPSEPRIISSLDTAGQARGITVNGNFAHVADYHMGLQMIDISNAYAPVLKKTSETPDLSCDVAVLDDNAYVADRISGLQIIDIALSSDAAMIASEDTPGFAYGIAMKGDTACVTDGIGGLQLIDVSDTSNPAMVGSVSLPDKAYGITLVGELAYVASGDGGLQVIDMKTPSAPKVIGSEETPEFAQGVAVEDDIACVADWDALHIMDVSTPSSPALIKSLGMPGHAMNVRLAQGFAYVADGSSGLQIVDTHTPSASQIVGYWDSPGTAFDVWVIGNIAYVADGKSGLQVIDISTPSKPGHLRTLDTPGSATAITIIGNIAYVADGESGLQVIDVSRPSAPRLISSAETEASAQDLAVIGDTAYVAASDSGLLILPIPIEIQPLTVKSETNISLTLPSPVISGHYMLTVLAGEENYELPGAVTFIRSDNSDILKSGAILVEGSGDTAKTCTEYAYKALLSQGYSKDAVYYLSPDTKTDADGDGMPDADVETTYQNLSYAITEWAKSYSNVLLYMTGSSSDSAFILNETENITALQLKGLADNLQQAISGRLIFIYDASQPQGFSDQMKPQAGKERIVITSASSHEDARFERDGQFSFSCSFWMSLSLNANLYNAFLNAGRVMEGYQRAFLDADGDGKGNEADDKYLAEDIVIGRGYAASSDLSKIQNVSDAFMLNGERSAAIQASGVTGSHGVENVLAVITPPGKTSRSPEELWGPDEDGVYKTYYDGFTSEGAYKIRFYASDERGIYSLPVQSTVIQTDGNPSPKGDLSGDWTPDLADAVTGLKILSGGDVSGSVWWDYSPMSGDVNADMRISWEEIFYILKKK
ncbi:hypothetical protein QUF80_18105 [Desulfococcaceae bacterium HSG8]|nr:hypothetical protein [Desulfococcaceae bacterium HSG8]